MLNKTVCFLNSSKSWGGGEKWHCDNALFLSQKEYHITVFTNRNSQLAKELSANHKIKLIQLKVSNLSFLNPFRIIELSKWLKKISPDYLIINLPSDLKLIGITSMFIKIPIIIYRRGSAIPIKNSFLNRLLFRKVITGVIANSIATKKTILQNNKSLFPEDKIKLIYNGINLDPFLTDQVKNKKNISEGIILGHIGRFSKEKNQRFLIEVANKLKNKNISFQLMLGGEGRDFEDISKTIEEYQLSKQIKLLKFVKDTPQFMSSIDIFLLPSLWEGFGYVTIEAMASSKPVIAFNVASNPEIIIDKKTGFLTREGDLDSFVEKIIFFYNNPVKISEMGIEGQKRVIEKFSINNSYNELEKYLINNI